MKSLVLFSLFCGAHCFGNVGIICKAYVSSTLAKAIDYMHTDPVASWIERNVSCITCLGAILLNKPSIVMSFAVMIISAVPILFAPRPYLVDTFLAPLSIITLIFPYFLLLSKLSIACKTSYIIFGAISLVLLSIAVIFKRKFKPLYYNGSDQQTDQKLSNKIIEIVSALLVSILIFVAHRYLNKYLHIIYAGILIAVAIYALIDNGHDPSFSKFDIKSKIYIGTKLTNTVLAIGIFIFQIRALMGYVSTARLFGIFFYISFFTILINFADTVLGYFPESLESTKKAAEKEAAEKAAKILAEQIENALSEEPEFDQFVAQSKKQASAFQPPQKNEGCKEILRMTQDRFNQLPQQLCFFFLYEHVYKELELLKQKSTDEDYTAKLNELNQYIYKLEKREFFENKPFKDEYEKLTETDFLHDTNAYESLQEEFDYFKETAQLILQLLFRDTNLRKFHVCYNAEDFGKHKNYKILAFFLRAVHLDFGDIKDFKDKVEKCKEAVQKNNESEFKKLLFELKSEIVEASNWLLAFLKANKTKI